MADFSRYGTPSAEWDEFVPYNPLDLYANGLDKDVINWPIEKIEELQKESNDMQIARAAKIVEDDGLAERVDMFDFEIPSRQEGAIPIRVYRAKIMKDASLEKLPVYLYFHGGGFMFGTLDGEDFNCAFIADSMDILVISVCYRHSPQYKDPTQRNDSRDALQWTLENAPGLGGDLDQLLVGGISAGGALASWLSLEQATEAHKNGTKSPIKGIFLGIPLLVWPKSFPHHLIKSKEVSSYWQCRDAPVVPIHELYFFEDTFSPQDDLGDKFLDLDDGKLDALSRLPKVALFVCGRDIFRDEGLILSENLKRAKVPARTYIFEGLPHGFRRYAHLPSTSKWNAYTIDSLKWLLDDSKDKGGKPEWQWIEVKPAHSN